MQEIQNRQEYTLTARANPFLALVGFLVLVIGGGIVISMFTPPDAWFAALEKPTFNPPNWIFGPVWTVLYVCIAVAGWRQWVRDRHGPPLRLWWLQLILNFLWSPAFFGAHQIDTAMAAVLGLFIANVLFILSVWYSDRISVVLFVPYTLWVGFAGVLNFAFLVLNP